METQFPWDVFFAVLICLAAVLFAAAGAVTLLNKLGRWQFRIAAAALVSMLLSVASGAIYLGHPERIFGAFANPNSVLSRELMVVLVLPILMAVFVYRLWREAKAPKVLSVLAIAAAIMALVLTVQLIKFWTSDGTDESFLLQPAVSSCSLLESLLT